MYKILYSNSALKDAAKIKRSNLYDKCRALIQLITVAPFALIPPYEKLVGDLNGFYFRRINIHHRLVYSVDESQRVIKVLRMWSHYE